MESLGLIAFIIWVIVQSSRDKKKPTNSREHQSPFPADFPIPGGETKSRESTESQDRNPIGFEIPPIQGAPGGRGEVQEYPIEYEDNQNYEEYPIFNEESTAPWEWQPEEPPTEEIIAAEPEPTTEENSKHWLPLLNTPETAREAVIYAEIFGKPKALRRR